MLSDEILATDKQVGYITWIIDNNFKTELGDYIRGSNGQVLGTFSKPQCHELIKCLVSQDKKAFKRLFKTYKHVKSQDLIED
jgi:hypothetical protein